MKRLIQILVGIGFGLVLSGCKGAPLPTYHTGEDSIYSNAINMVRNNQSQEKVYQLLGKPTKKYLDWGKTDIERNMNKSFKNAKSYTNLDTDDKFDLWYYFSKKHKSYAGIQTNTYVTIPKFCYFAFSVNRSQLAWHQCFTAKEPK